MIAVLGDTSSGKSSLLSSLSGIPLPAASRLTTKCPVQLQLEKSKDPSSGNKRATIRIQWRPNAVTDGSLHQSGNGTISPRERKRALERDRPPVFEERVIDTLDANGDKIDEDWDAKVVQVIQEAQDTILGYRQSSQVAPDVISVHVHGPHIAYPVTLVDLPGLVQYQPKSSSETQGLNATESYDDEQYHDPVQGGETNNVNLNDDGSIEEKKYDETKQTSNNVTNTVNNDSNLLKEVQQVMKEYFSNERCLLLVVLSAAVNIHNSKVLSMAQSVDPYTTRTIPVLTKPDLIDPGAEGDVSQLLLSSPSQRRTSGVHNLYPTSLFRHGFYLVKNRGQAQLDQKVTLDTGLQQEKEYFATTHPWATLPSHVRKFRLGVPVLLQTLAQLQWEMTLSTLPQVLQEIRVQRDSCMDILNRLGPAHGTKKEQRRYYQSVLQDLSKMLQASLSGRGLLGGKGKNFRKKGAERTTTGTKCKVSGLNVAETIATSISSTKKKVDGSQRQPLAAARLHHACAEFCDEIRSGALATVQKLVEGGHVLVSNPNGGDDVQGEIVHLDEHRGFACIDFIHPDDHNTDVLFDAIGYSARNMTVTNSAPGHGSTTHHSHPSGAVDVVHHDTMVFTGAGESHGDEGDIETDEDRLEEDEVWSDGQHVYIARQYPLVDRLRPILLKRIRTDPSWLLEKIANYRTDDLACFINADIFKHIVAEFVQQDWAPPCYQLVETTREIIMSTLDDCLKEALELHGIFGHDNSSANRPTIPSLPSSVSSPKSSSSSRFPLFRQSLFNTCHEVAEELLATAKEQLESHMDLEQSYPYTQDDVLLDTIAQSRYETLKRDLELQLRLDQEGVVLDTQAIQTILDRVFDKHRSGSSSPSSSTAVSQTTSPPPPKTSAGALAMAEELELILSCYGKVATQRVLDRTPMICWQICRSLKPKIEQSLACVTDETLEEWLWESPETIATIEATTQKLHELDKAMERIQKLQQTLQ